MLSSIPFRGAQQSSTSSPKVIAESKGVKWTHSPAPKAYREPCGNMLKTSALD
jgi:hypothetical protein